MESASLKSISPFLKAQGHSLQWAIYCLLTLSVLAQPKHFVDSAGAVMGPFYSRGPTSDLPRMHLPNLI